MPVADVDAYDPATDTWTRVAEMPTPRLELAAATGADGKIYTFGGQTAAGGNTDLVEVVDPLCTTQP